MENPLRGSPGREVCSGNHTNVNKRRRRPREQVLGSHNPVGCVTLSQAVNFLRLGFHISETQTVSVLPLIITTFIIAIWCLRITV